MTPTRTCRRCLDAQALEAFPVLPSGYLSTVCTRCQGTPIAQPCGVVLCPICGIPAPQHWTCAKCGCRGHLIPHTQAAGLCDWCLEEQTEEAHHVA